MTVGDGGLTRITTSSMIPVGDRGVSAWTVAAAAVADAVDDGTTVAAAAAAVDAFAADADAVAAGGGDGGVSDGDDCYWRRRLRPARVGS